MAARGRGGKTTSLTHEQLQAMGVGKDAIQQVQTVPPPTFPTLLNKPTKTEKTKEDEQDMTWKEDYLKYLHESPYHKRGDHEQAVVVTLGAWEKWAEMILGPKKVIPEEYDWARMPKELQMKNRKRKVKLKQASAASAKKAAIANPVEKLKELEEKEKTENRTEKTTKPDADDSDEDDNEEEFVADEEMDDENDYGVNYFDNGEAYNEEDDNLDDGPIY